MLRLAEQIGGDQRRIGAAVGDDEQLAGAGRHVDRRAAGQARHIGLGFGDPGIAGPADLGDGRDGACAESERGDRLRAAHGPHRLDAAQLGGKRDQGSSPPSARGGVTATISVTPAARAGSASMSRVEKSGVLPPGM
jgi:hypothetical protein